MALKQVDILRSANPDYYGIIDAVEIQGHRTAPILSDLYDIPDFILSRSRVNTDSDALGQLWYVVSEGCYYQLVSWNNRGTESGWKALDLLEKSTLDSYLTSATAASQYATIDTVSQVQSDLGSLESNKQESLTAGTGIDITNDVISATVDLSDIEGDISDLETAVAGKQATLTAGTGISISSNTISATVDLSDIEGDIDDLESSKQDVLTAGTGISIDADTNTIIATVSLTAIENDIVDLETAVDSKQGNLIAGANITLNGNTISASYNAPFRVVAALPTASADTVDLIYLVLEDTEWIQYWTTESSGTYSWTSGGVYQVDIDGYVTQTDADLSYIRSEIITNIADIL